MVSAGRRKEMMHAWRAIPAKPEGRNYCCRILVLPSWFASYYPGIVCKSVGDCLYQFSISKINQLRERVVSACSLDLFTVTSGQAWFLRELCINFSQFLKKFFKSDASFEEVDNMINTSGLNFIFAFLCENLKNGKRTLEPSWWHDLIRK